MSDPPDARTKSAVAKKPIKKIRPARKQVAVDQIDKSESVQTGKEYNIWYNKWAGGDREDSYGQDDMGGVGSFGRQNRTLYVGKMREGATKADTEEIVRRHFGEWGEIVKLNILHNRGVAFVTWATEDPNPRSIVDERQRLEELGKAGITSKIDVHADLVEAVQAVKALEDGDVDDLYPIPDPTMSSSRGVQQDDNGDGDEPPSKRMRLEDGTSSTAAGGLFGGDAMENIKYFADLARQQAQQQQQQASTSNGKTAAVAASKPSASALVGGYGSDSDEE
ncbi:hypothetical protein QFC22_005897 [Naganishia vaughanmartiniae]|uniref:Uncharacterized protein n=1 Tax=Naganishia vaughanmartiniae TaxID=1424756 RepID=A0ACC2WU67_9TREE|nr:hypothetical protein QFC22_005897 [Naganishia vaughanmartiniae]